MGRPILRRLLLVLVMVTLVGWGIVRHAPFYLPDLPAQAVPVTEGPHSVFGYATLANPLVRLFVIGRPAPSRAAELGGFRRVGRNLVKDPAAQVPGRVFVVDADSMQRLDRYEEFGLRYDRELLRLTDGSMAWVYRLMEPASAE